MPDMRRPGLFDLFRKLGYELTVPSHVEAELIDTDVREMIAGLVNQGTVRTVRMNGRRDVLDLGSNFQGIGFGECDAILACIKMRRRGARVQCVLDDKKARAAARKIGIEHIGLAGLLGELASAGLMTAQDMASTVAALRNTNFRITDDLLDGLVGGI